MARQYDRAPCGTYGGYIQHTARHQPPCDACKAARRDYQRARRRQGRDTWVNQQRGTCVRGLGWPR